jgi:hypothetical protein
MEYDKEFNELWENKLKFISRVSGPADETTCEISFAETHKLKAYEVWQAARKDHYRIGEEVESQYNDGKWFNAVVVVYHGELYKDEVKVNVRRIPAWKPKEGEAVMFPWYTDENTRVWCAGTYHNGMIYFGDDYSSAAVEHCRPFSAEKIGKPWDEI